jgi:hypothetical protein
MSRVLLIWFTCWAWLFESWEGDYRVVWVQDSLVAIGKTLCDWVSIPPREICFIAIARQTQASYHQNC